MSEPVEPLGGASAGILREIGPLGMVTLRAKPDAAGLAAALGAIPPVRGVVEADGHRIAWMSPDEYLILTELKDVPQVLDDISKTMDSAHHLAVDVSDARAVFHLSGPGADTTLSRLCPVDFPRLPAGEVRRTRLAQVACALWREGDGITVVTFRSVKRYAFDVLNLSLT
jgi:sarcosine oxidase, subunit gamma